jgi:hypothetical protein
MRQSLTELDNSVAANADQQKNKKFKKVSYTFVILHATVGSTSSIEMIELNLRPRL